MISVTLSYIANTLGWTLIGDDDVIDQICTDSRTATQGDCFIALYGDNFDGHDFIPHVIDKGARALIVSQRQVGINLPQLIVDDTRRALAQLAGLIKSLANVKTVAITGSCGKTTVKEMMTAILQQQGRVLSTAGNFNNEIGVPLTLLRLEKQHQFAVIELGANHIGEINFTSEITKPDIAIITNIGAAHLEGFGGIDGVVKAKSEIFNHLAENAFAVFDGDIAYAERWRDQNKQRNVACFSDVHSLTNQSDVWASGITIDSHGNAQFRLHCQHGAIDIELPLPGRHNVKNALAAATAALAMGLTLDDIAAGLYSMAAVKGRLNISVISAQLTLIDDTYNANSASIKAAIEVLGHVDTKKYLVLGDMAELGDYAIECHQSLGPVIDSNNIDQLLTFGELSTHYGQGYEGVHRHFNDKQALYDYLEQQIINFSATERATVLVKGSRSAAMESVVEFIKKNKNIGATT